VRNLLEFLPGYTVIQPANRETSAALALCLNVIASRTSALVSLLPSDHYYSSSSAFCESIESGLRLTEGYPDCILVVGAEARYPEVEYGWIQPGRTLMDSLVNPLLRVSRFWEKPSLQHAEVLQRVVDVLLSQGLGRTETPTKVETLEVVA
jgi:mannose-1-phosphate guanylyltransferase